MKRTWGLRNASAADVGVASLTFALAKPPSKQRPKHPPLEVAIGIVESHEDRYGSARVLFVHADSDKKKLRRLRRRDVVTETRSTER